MSYRVRLKNVENVSLEEINIKLKNGYRFIVYPFCISLLVSNIHAVSPAFLIGPNDYVKKKIQFYNFVSLVFGWWSIPFGPTNTINSIKTNLRGGIDITGDILLNLTQESLQSRKLKIEKLYTIFSSVPESTKKDFLKAINQTKGIDAKNIYLGKYLNTDQICYFVGFESISEASFIALHKILRKIFADHVHIEILEINSEDEIHSKLVSQGEKLK